VTAREPGTGPGHGAAPSGQLESLPLPGGWPEPAIGHSDGEDMLPPQPMYGSVEAWVTGQFLPMFRRPLGGEFRWCSQWWQHAEAITRLTALWHSWETLRLEPGTGMAAWLRDHLDHQLPVLLGRGGPFAQCSEDEHIEPREARVADAPLGWWDLEIPAPGGENGGAP
jgi:Domain of unknown function (DUF4913)